VRRWAEVVSVGDEWTGGLNPGRRMTGPSNRALSSRWNVFVLNYTQLLSSYHLLLNVQVVRFFLRVCQRSWGASPRRRLFLSPERTTQRQTGGHADGCRGFYNNIFHCSWVIICFCIIHGIFGRFGNGKFEQLIIGASGSSKTFFFLLVVWINKNIKRLSSGVSGPTYGDPFLLRQ
jgi:hypothetical protein